LFKQIIYRMWKVKNSFIVVSITRFSFLIFELLFSEQDSVVG